MSAHFVFSAIPVRHHRGAIGAMLLAVVALLLAIAGMVGTPPAMAGKYIVSQCAALAPPNYHAVYAGDAYEGPNNSIRYATSGRNCFSNVDSALRIRSIAAASQGDAADFRWTAPDGTRFVYVDSQISFDRASGHQPELFFQNEGGADRIVLQSGSTSDWVYRFTSAERRQLLMRLRCSESGGCPSDSGAAARIRNLVFVVDDLVPPEVSMSGPLASGNWVSGNVGVTVSGTDAGSGVAFLSLKIGNPTTTPVRSSYWECGYTSVLDSNGVRTGVARKLRACAMSDETPGAVDEEPRQASWQVPKAALPEGRSKVFACAKDLAHGVLTGGIPGPNPANETCVEKTILVDHTPPAAPVNLSVKGGDGWRIENSFDLSWTSPAEEGERAPVAKVRYRITGTDQSGEQHDTGDVVVDANGEGLEGLSVPGGPGEYQIRVWLEDAAGNQNPANFGVATLRFDPAEPPGSQPDRVNGYLNKGDFPYTQEWEAIPAEFVPASGIAGYAVAVNRDPEADPCVTPGDPQVQCAQSEITHLGKENRFATLTQLGDGRYFVHVVVVAGNGLRSPEVKRAPLDVDISDPEVEVRGWSEGWTRTSQGLEIVAEDAVSGMSPANEVEGTSPAVLWQLNLGEVSEAEGDSTTVLIDEEGANSLQVWARDVAGNVSEPISVPVLIDKTPPVAHLLPMEETDGRVRAVIADHLSGVEAAWIGVRGSGDGDWREVPANIVDELAYADVNWDELEPGKYELRIRAEDRAGNETVATQLEDGSPVEIDLPDRLDTRAQLSLIKKVKKSKRKAEKQVTRLRVGYNKRAIVQGTVADPQGHPMSGNVVHIHTRFVAGSKVRDTVREVKLDDQGRFRINLPKGPSRVVWVEHPSTLTHRRSVSRTVKVDTVGHIRLSAPKRVRGDRLEFRGKVGTRGVLSKKGHVVEIQVRVGKGWATVKKAVRTNRAGSFRLGYRFKNRYVSPVRFTFRARLLSQSGLPYKRSTSKPVKVVVSS